MRKFIKYMDFEYECFCVSQEETTGESPLNDVFTINQFILTKLVPSAIYLFQCHTV